MDDIEKTLIQDYEAAKYQEQEAKLQAIRIYAQVRREYIESLYKRLFKKDINQP